MLDKAMHGLIWTTHNGQHKRNIRNELYTYDCIHDNNRNELYTYDCIHENNGNHFFIVHLIVYLLIKF